MASEITCTSKKKYIQHTHTRKQKKRSKTEETKESTGSMASRVAIESRNRAKAVHPHSKKKRNVFGVVFIFRLKTGPLDGNCFLSFLCVLLDHSIESKANQNGSFPTNGNDKKSRILRTSTFFCLFDYRRKRSQKKRAK